MAWRQGHGCCSTPPTSIAPLDRARAVSWLLPGCCCKPFSIASYLLGCTGGWVLSQASSSAKIIVLQKTVPLGEDFPATFWLRLAASVLMMSLDTPSTTLFVERLAATVETFGMVDRFDLAWVSSWPMLGHAPCKCRARLALVARLVHLRRRSLGHRHKHSTSKWLTRMLISSPDPRRGGQTFPQWLHRWQLGAMSIANLSKSWDASDTWSTNSPAIHVKS